MGHTLLLRLRLADDQRDCWVVPLLTEVATERGWTIDEAGSRRPDALALIRTVGDAVPPVDEPAFVTAVEPGTPRSPNVVESAPHLLPRFDLVVGGFKARRNQQVTRDAIERFLERVELERPAELHPADAVSSSEASGIIAENRALLDAVDAWLARTSMTPVAAQAIHADRTILEAAIGAPAIDVLIVERAATRLAAAIAP